MQKSFTPVTLLESELRQYKTDLAYWDIIRDNKNPKEAKYAKQQYREARKKVRQFEEAIQKLKAK